MSKSEPSSKPNTVTLAANRSFVTFRFGQDIIEISIASAILRVPLLHMAAIILFNKATKDGLEIVDISDKKTPIEDLTKKWNDNLYTPAISRGMIFEGSYGATAFLWTKGRSNGDDPELLAFKTENISLNVNAEGLIDKYKLTEKIDSKEQPELVHKIDTKAKIANVVYVVLRQGEVFWRGIPIWIALWDVAWAHYVSLEATMVTDVRVGYGIKKATIADRESVPKNVTARSKMTDGLQKMSSGDSNIVLSSGFTSEGKEWRDELEVDFGSGSVVDKSTSIDSYHKVAAFLSSVPKNLYDGIFAGETLAADRIYLMIQEALHELREPWIPYLNKLGKQWCKMIGKQWKENYTFQWVMPKTKLTERETAEIELIETQTVISQFQAGLISLEDAQVALELDKNTNIDKPDEKLKIDVTGFDDKKDEEKDIDQDE